MNEADSDKSKTGRLSKTTVGTQITANNKTRDDAEAVVLKMNEADSDESKTGMLSKTTVGAQITANNKTTDDAEADVLKMNEADSGESKTERLSKTTVGSQITANNKTSDDAKADALKMNEADADESRSGRLSKTTVGTQITATNKTSDDAEAKGRLLKTTSATQLTADKKTEDDREVSGNTMNVTSNGPHAQAAQYITNNINHEYKTFNASFDNSTSEINNDSPRSYAINGTNVVNHNNVTKSNNSTSSNNTADSNNTTNSYNCRNCHSVSNSNNVINSNNKTNCNNNKTIIKQIFPTRVNSGRPVHVHQAVVQPHASKSIPRNDQKKMPKSKIQIAASTPNKNMMPQKQTKATPRTEVKPSRRKQDSGVRHRKVNDNLLQNTKPTPSTSGAMLKKQKAKDKVNVALEKPKQTTVNRQSTSKPPIRQPIQGPSHINVTPNATKPSIQRKTAKSSSGNVASSYQPLQATSHLRNQTTVRKLHNSNNKNSPVTSGLPLVNPVQNTTNHSPSKRVGITQKAKLGKAKTGVGQKPKQSKSGQKSQKLTPATKRSATK